MIDMAIDFGRTIDVNGTTIYCEEQGQGEPLLLLHGGLVSTSPVWAGSPASWASHMAAFAQHFRVIAPDTPGGLAGRSTLSAAQLATSNWPMTSRR